MDATYSRGNANWPSDPRCQALPDNDTRWLNEILWRRAAQDRASILGPQYNPKWCAWIACIPEDRIQECLKPMAALGLISFMREGDNLVVWGARKNHAKLLWHVLEPAREDTHNPWETDLDWVWEGGLIKPTTVPRKAPPQAAKRATDSTSPKPKAQTDPKQKDILLGRFQAFWTAYPKKRSKGTAEKAWLKIKPTQELTKTIIAAIAIQKRGREWIKDDGQFVPNPASWLNAKGWENEDTDAPDGVFTHGDDDDERAF